MLDLTVVQYADLARQVYADPPDVGPADGAARAKFYQGGSVLAFRGTDDILSVAADALAVTLPIVGLGPLHAGIWTALTTILPALLARPKPDVIVGHSEGAALALMYGGVLTLLHHLPVTIYGFEPPKICGDDTLRQLFAQNGVMRFLTRNGSDWVPEVPPNLRHPGHLSQIGSTPGLLPSTDDHLIDNVIAALTPH